MDPDGDRRAAVCRREGGTQAERRASSLSPRPGRGKQSEPGTVESQPSSLGQVSSQTSGLQQVLEDVQGRAGHGLCERGAGQLTPALKGVVLPSRPFPGGPAQGRSVGCGYRSSTWGHPHPSRPGPRSPGVLCGPRGKLTPLRIGNCPQSHPVDGEMSLAPPDAPWSRGCPWADALPLDE